MVWLVRGVAFSTSTESIGGSCGAFSGIRLTRGTSLARDPVMPWTDVGGSGCSTTSLSVERKEAGRVQFVMSMVSIGVDLSAVLHERRMDDDYYSIVIVVQPFLMKTIGMVWKN